MTHEVNEKQAMSNFMNMVEVICNTNSKSKLIEFYQTLTIRERADVMAYMKATTDEELFRRIRNYVENYLAR